MSDDGSYDPNWYTNAYPDYVAAQAQDQQAILTGQPSPQAVTPDAVATAYQQMFNAPAPPDFVAAVVNNYSDSSIDNVVKDMATSAATSSVPFSNTPGDTNSFTAGINHYLSLGYKPGGTTYDGLPTSFVNPQTGQVVASYGTIAPVGGASTAVQSSNWTWNDASKTPAGFTTDVAKAKTPDTSLVDFAKVATSIAAAVAAPELLGLAQSGLMTLGLSAESAQAAAPVLVGAAKSALTSALSGGNVLTSAATGGVTGGIAPYISDAISGSLSDVLDKASADILAKGISGALSGGATGAIGGTNALVGAEVGGFSGALNEILGQGIGGVSGVKDTSGSNISTFNQDPIGLIATGAIDPPQYQYDAFGNVLLDEQGNPVPVLDTAKEDAAAAKSDKEITSAAKSVLSPYISKTLTGLFGISSTNLSDQLVSGTSSSSKSPYSSLAQQTSTRLSSPQQRAASSSYNYGTGVQTQASPGSQALSQALGVGAPSLGTSGTAGETEDPSTGGTPQNVWNQASLRVKDSTGEYS